MAVTTVDVQTPDGTMDVEVRGPADAPTVIFLPDAGGIRPVMRDMAERLAAGGYRVALANILHRSGPLEEGWAAHAFSDPAVRARMMDVIALATHDAVMRDVGALLDALGPAQRPVATVGYCLGGARSFGAAGAYPGRVAAAASFHGGNLAADKPDSPHHLTGAIRGELYFGVAADDPSFPPEQEKRLVAALDAAGVRYDLEHYEARHGFAVADNPSYDQAADARHQAALAALLKRTIGAG